MKDSHDLSLDKEFLARLRKKGLGGFATVAEQMTSEAAHLVGGRLIPEEESLPVPVPAYRIEWTREYEAVLGPRKEHLLSFHLTSDFAIQYLLTARSELSQNSESKTFFPHTGWDKPIALKVAHIVTMGPVLSGLLTKGSISEMDFFERKADGKRVKAFEDERERYRAFMLDARSVVSSKELLEIELPSVTLHGTKKERRDFGKLNKCSR